jgi:hypothetical protein
MLLKLIPNKLKVWLIKHLYADIAAMGDGGDTTLAHVNFTEVALLKAHGGAGTINPRTGLVEFKGKGGGGSPAPQQNTTYSSDLPEYAKPFYEELLKQSGKETYTTDASGNVTGVRTDAPYTGDRLAGFTTDQLNVQSNLRGMTAPSEYGSAISATGTLTGIGTGAAASGLGAAGAFTPGTVSSQQISGYPGITAASVGTPNTVGAQQVGAQPQIYSGAFTDPGVAASYMNPYQQQVTDVQLAEARRQGDIAKSGRGMGSINRGTFGGGRQALMEGEADRALATQLGAIQATGSQQAYQQGQQAFQADQARGLQAQQSNVQYGMQGQLANQQASLDSAKANQQALLQAGQLDQAAKMQAQIQNQQAAIDAAKANQGANLQAQQLSQQGQQFGAGLQKDVGLAGLQYGLAGSNQLGALAGQEQQTQLELQQAQAASGAEQQAMDQEELNIAYQQFMEQQDATKRALEFQNNILRGTAGALGSTQTQYTPAPSLASQITGMGVAGLGLYNALS